MGGSGSGRPRKPLEQRALDARGNNGRDLGKRRVTPPGTEVVIPGRVNHPIAFDHDDGSLPEIPAYLGKAGRKAWFDVWDFNPHLHPYIDWPEVAILASCYDDIASYREILQYNGNTVIFKGETIAHPLIKSVRDAQMVILKIRDRLALNPVSRARLGIAEIKKASGLADLQNKFVSNSRALDSNDQEDSRPARPDETTTKAKVIKATVVRDEDSEKDADW